MQTVLRFLIVFLCLWSAYACSQIQNNVPSSPAQYSAITSLKDVKSLYIGQIIGEPKLVTPFRQELEKQLQLHGFKVVQNKEQADAVLLGELTTERVWANLVQFLKFPDAHISLINDNYQVVWKKEFGQSFSCLYIAKCQTKHTNHLDIKDRAIEVSEYMAHLKSKP